MSFAPLRLSSGNGGGMNVMCGPSSPAEDSKGDVAVDERRVATFEDEDECAARRSADGKRAARRIVCAEDVSEG